MQNSGDLAAGEDSVRKKRARVDAHATTTTGTVTPPSQQQQQQILSKQRQDEILRLMICDLSSPDRNKIYLALTTLAKLCNKEDEPQNYLAHAKFIVEHDGIGLIRHVLATTSYKEEGDRNNNKKKKKTKSSKEIAKIMGQGVRALLKLMCHIDGDDDDAYHKVHRLGAVEITIRAMQDYLEYSCYLQDVGCCFLNTFMQNSAQRTKMVANLDGISTIIQAMDEYPGNLNLQRNACGALSIFCDEKELVGKVFMAGGLSAAARAIENHNFSPFHTKRTKKAIRALHDYL